MTLNFDHYTPLSRAVASIDRDSYAARFAIYDREYKALLRRLASAESPCSDADLAREERAFRDAVRQVEFADEDERLTLVPEPAEEAPRELRPDPSWMEAPPLRREAIAVPVNPPSLDDPEPSIAIEPIVLSQPRSIARKVTERLALAVAALILGWTWVWMAPGPQDMTNLPSLRGAVGPPDPVASINTTDAKSQQPAWLSPDIFYAPAPAPAPTPRADVPLPMPRPER
jgi:hypothetical protein